MDPHDIFNWDWNLVFWDSDGSLIDMGCKLQAVHADPSLNDYGQIVGSFKFQGDSDFRSYYWDEDSGFISADDFIAEDSHWTTAGFIEINNQGQILGSSEGHAVILTPVPEPTSLSILLLGTLLLSRKATFRIHKTH